LTYQNQSTMFQYQLRILAQYEENYAAHNTDWDGKAESWKHKGGVEFIANVDSDFRMCYGPDEVREAVKNVLEIKSSKAARYTLIEFDYADSKPEDITQDLLRFAEDNWKQKHEVKQNYPIFEP
jgi:hypothetical protein